MSKITYDSALVIGMGLIGSSIVRAIKEKQISKKIFAIDRDSEVINISKNLNLVDAIAVSYTHLTLPTTPYV